MVPSRWERDLLTTGGMWSPRSKAPEPSAVAALGHPAWESGPETLGPSETFPVPHSIISSVTLPCRVCSWLCRVRGQPLARRVDPSLPFTMQSLLSTSVPSEALCWLLLC